MSLARTAALSFLTLCLNLLVIWIESRRSLIVTMNICLLLIGCFRRLQLLLEHGLWLHLVWERLQTGQLCLQDVLSKAEKQIVTHKGLIDVFVAQLSQQSRIWVQFKQRCTLILSRHRSWLLIFKLCSVPQPSFVVYIDCCSDSSQTLLDMGQGSCHSARSERLSINLVIV